MSSHHDTHCHPRRHGLYGPRTDQDPAPPSGGRNRRRHQPAGRPAADRNDPPLAHRPAGSAPGRPGSGGNRCAGRMCFQLPAAWGQQRRDPTPAGRRYAGRRLQRRLSPQRCGGLRPVVWPETQRPRTIGEGCLRPAGTVSRRNSLGPARGQPGLLSDHGDPALRLC